MDGVTILLVVLIVLFLCGGLAWPRAAEGSSPINVLLYVLAVVVLVVVLVRLLGAV